MSEHDQHCFIAAPAGRDELEQQLYKGWRDEVIAPVVADLKLKAMVAVDGTAPTKITDEMREHLAHDRLAIFDLGGLTGPEPANANVVYELGIRHAFNLPAIVIARRDQPLPFDIGEQRAIKGDRHFGTLAWHRDQLHKFCSAALNGDFFKPMEAIRIAKLVASIAGASGDDVLKALAQQIQELQRTVASLASRMVIAATPSLAGLEAALGGHSALEEVMLSRYQDQQRRQWDYSGPPMPLTEEAKRSGEPR
jgi:hypothetical protein